MLKKIDHINIVVSSLVKSISFFKELGFEFEQGAVLQGKWISAVVGLPDVLAEYASLCLPGTQTRLELIQYTQPNVIDDSDVSKPNALGFRHLAFEVTDIEAMVRKLQAMEVKMLSSIQVFPKTGKKLIYFLGPDGILLELAEYVEPLQKSD